MEKVGAVLVKLVNDVTQFDEILFDLLAAQMMCCK